MQQVEHELHQRRRSRNLGLLAVLLAFVALVFGLSVVKITQGDMMEGYDHRPRASVLPQDPNAPARDAAPVAAPGTPGALVDGTVTAPAAATAEGAAVEGGQ
ncbi:hypothetical protein [Paracoccus lutimaris]|uniref:Cytochrome C oxidase assembly protein n=1 Tax=Paracoccus lutimaris TaxID=1490030 RepID=A0A368Z988_9RHOB|nr:hypothetical protein [Paracoccus lutimaris]RCW88961.1 hypothetical protein DFP89_101400 [Paracoccus lutimaris]